MGGGTYSLSRRGSNVSGNVSYSAYKANVAPHAVFREKSVNSAMSP